MNESFLRETQGERENIKACFFFFSFDKLQLCTLRITLLQKLFRTLASHSFGCCPTDSSLVLCQHSCGHFVVALSCRRFRRKSYFLFTFYSDRFKTGDEKPTVWTSLSMCRTNFSSCTIYSKKKNFPSLRPFLA